MKRILIAGEYSKNALTGSSAVEMTPSYQFAVNAVGAVGATAAARDEADARALCEAFDALILPGGRDIPAALYGQEPHPACSYDDPLRDLSDRLLFDAFRAAGKRILGICRGCQAGNVFLGGTLHQHLQGMGRPVLQHPSNFNPGHAASVLPGTRLAKLLGEGETLVNSSHHQAIMEPGEGLTICALAPDGVIEAAEGEGVLLIQWHPERMGEAMRPLFRWIIGEE